MTLNENKSIENIKTSQPNTNDDVMTQHLE